MKLYYMKYCTILGTVVPLLQSLLMRCPLTAFENLTSRWCKLFGFSPNLQIEARREGIRDLQRCTRLKPWFGVVLSTRGSRNLETQAPPADCFVGHDFGKEKARWLGPWPARVPRFFLPFFLGWRILNLIWTPTCHSNFLSFFRWSRCFIIVMWYIQSWPGPMVMFKSILPQQAFFWIIGLAHDIIHFCWYVFSHTTNPCWKLGTDTCHSCGIRFFSFLASWILWSVCLSCM